MVFLGTGTSERVPRVTCLTKQPPTCAVCTDAVRPGSKNLRRNTSLLLQYDDPEGRRRNVVIDAGKSFYESAMTFFPRFGVTSLDAVIITHAHADAIGGLDDLRDWTNNAHESVPVFVRPVDLETIAKTHFYLVDRSLSTSGGGVARLEFFDVTDDPLDIYGLEFTPLTVEHGPGVTASGFKFADVCYIPDTSRIPHAAWQAAERCGLLVLDALRPERTHGSHLTVEEAVDVARRLEPGRTLLTDMAHDVEHEPTNERLALLKEAEGLDIQLAYDGLAVDVEL